MYIDGKDGKDGKGSKKDNSIRLDESHEDMYTQTKLRVDEQIKSIFTDDGGLKCDYTIIPISCAKKHICTEYLKKTLKHP